VVVKNSIGIETRYPESGQMSFSVTPTAALPSNWHIYDKTSPGATITTVYDNQRKKKVTQFTGDGIINGYRLGYSGDKNKYSWRSTKKSIAWSMKFSEEFYIYISVMTKKGHRYIYFTPPKNIGVGLSPDHNYIHIPLYTNSKDGTWHNFEMNLELILKQYESDNEIITVNGFLVRGSGRVDDIELK